ncbi:MAG: SdrD B-like domain-containing protein [Nitrososphaerota archaeon]
MIKKLKFKSGLFRALAAILLALALTILLFAGLIGFAGAKGSEPEPRIWADKSDYSPGETATIYGEGFTPNTTIAITIQRPDNSEDTLCAESDSKGGFIAIYQLDGIEGEYTVTAKDKYGRTATTKFTDCSSGAITIELYGYTLEPNPEWTKGVVKGYLEDQRIPFKIEVKSKKSVSYNLNVTVHLDYNSADYGYGLDAVQNFTMWRNGVSETPNIAGPSPDGWEDGGKIQQLQFSWSFNINKDDDCTLYFEAHVAIGAHNYPGARIHVHIHSVASNPSTPVSQGNKDVPVQIGSATISGYKWNDKDGDGIKDRNEPTLGGWTINLYKFEGSWVHVESTNTTNNGRYSFKVYCAGTYMINETIKSGWTQTFPGNNSYIINILGPGAYPNRNFGNKEGVPPQEYPSISIDKSANATMAHVSDVIKYTYYVTNTGNVNLTNIQITDNLTSTPTYVGGDDEDRVLEPDETWTYNSTYTVKDSDPDPLVNNATVTATYNNQQVSAWDTWTVDILHPAISVTKTADKTKAYAGETITYTIIVTNVGDCPLYNVNVTDTLLDTLLTNGFLDVGESITFTGTYIVKAGDEDPLMNKVTAEGKDALGLVVSDDASASVDLVAKICGYKFHDTNKNGTKDGGEEGLGGWIIQLFRWNGTAWELINSTTTDSSGFSSGFYCFNGLNTGVYNVTEVLQTGWRNTTPTSITIELESGEVSQNNNFGNIRQYTLSVHTSPSGLNILVNGTGTSTPRKLYYDECTWVNLTAPNTIQYPNGTRYVFLYWNVNGANYTNNQVMIHMNAIYTATAYYKTQYNVTVTASPSGAIGGTFNVTYTQCGTTYNNVQGTTIWSDWVDANTNVTISSPQAIINISPGTRLGFDYYDPSSEVNVTKPETITLVYRTQYRLVVSILPDNLGIGNMAISPAGYDQARNGNWTSYWYDNCTYVTLNATEYVYMQGGRYKFGEWHIDSTENASRIVTVHMNRPINVTAEYGFAPAGIVTFEVNGVGNDYGGIILVVDGIYKYTVANISNAIFNWYPGENHNYTWYLALYVNCNKRYMWITTMMNGGQLPQNGTIYVMGDATITGYYKTQYRITFRQMGIGSDWTGAVLTVNGITYMRGQLPTSVWCDEGSTLSFAWHSPLIVSRTKAYGWYKTTGLSNKQSGIITVNSSGEIVGYYMKIKPPIVPPAGGGCKTSSKKGR